MDDQHRTGEPEHGPELGPEHASEHASGQGDPADEAFVRALLAEAGREPEPLPDEVGRRLDDALAGLVAERDRTDAPTRPVVVPLDRARQRRRRGLQVLVAAAAVVVGGWTVSSTGLLQGSGMDATSDSAGGSADMGSERGDPSTADADADADAFALSSDSLRSDARRLLAGGTTARERSSYVAGAEAPAAEDDRTPLGDLAADKSSDGPASGADAGAGAGVDGVPLPQTTASCVDPLAPARLTRLAVTYDGRSATAVLRPLRDAPDGAGRVRVEVWDCASPLRLAAVVVRR